MRQQYSKPCCTAPQLSHGYDRLRLPQPHVRANRQNKASPFITGPLVPVTILNPIRAVMGIHNHRFNLFGKCSRASFEREVLGCFGVMPTFFCSASAAPGLIQELWAFAKSAYIDSPLPSLFKERLFVHLSRFCEVRYCIVRHVGFLIGRGRPAGDPNVRPETIAQVITLLQRPVPDVNALAAVFARLKSYKEAK